MRIAWAVIFCGAKFAQRAVVSFAPIRVAAPKTSVHRTPLLHIFAFSFAQGHATPCSFSEMHSTYAAESDTVSEAYVECSMHILNIVFILAPRRMHVYFRKR